MKSVKKSSLTKSGKVQSKKKISTTKLLTKKNQRMTTSSTPKKVTKKTVSKPQKVKALKKVATGIFGGLFDPIHYGHLKSLSTVTETLNLKQVRVIPAWQSPLRHQVEGSAPEHRLEMVRSALAQDSQIFIVDDREIRRKGVSYTVKTVEELIQEFPNEIFHLIIGADQFAKFDQWFEYERILQKVHLIVTSRPGVSLPEDKADLPDFLKNKVKSFNKKKIKLGFGNYLYFVELEDVDISSTEIRRRLRHKQPIHEMVPSTVTQYIVDHSLYEKVGKKIDDYLDLTQFCARWLREKGAVNIKAFDLRSLNGLTDFAIVASGTSTRHASALSESLSAQVKEQHGVWPQGHEGAAEGRWVILDYGSLMVHIFYDYVRQEYRLEDLWAKGKEIPLPDLTGNTLPELRMGKLTPNP
ncbi:MAG: nicotinate (nicotinamide) nucleotide adenylyltransferase [Bdellovibrionales bacterium]|nr:nicotinate (nicotinamide) nucleotide adenylyltransferase [Bdellovibrionales bacterium]